MQFRQSFKKEYLGKVGVVIVPGERSVRLMHEKAGGAKMVWWALDAVKMEKEAGHERESNGEGPTTFLQKYEEEAGEI